MSAIRYANIIFENSNGLSQQPVNQIRYLANSHVFQTWGTGINSNLPLSTINSNIYHNTVMTINTSSNIGIGTTQPQSRIHITGNLQVDGILGNELLQYAPYLPMSPNNSNTFLRWMQYATSDQYRNNFAPTQSLMTGSFWGSNVMPFVRKYDSYSYSTVAAAAGYLGGVLLPDGRVLFTNRNTSTLGIFTPSNNTFSTISAIAGYWGGIIIPDGRVVLVPCIATSIGIFNPSTNIYTSISGITLPGTDAYIGGVLLPDGRVLFVPSNTGAIGLFNPNTNTFTTISAQSGYIGGVLLPDGRVVLVPNNTNFIGLFNPTTNIYSSVVGFPVGYSNGGCLLPDGRVLFVPDGGSIITIFNPNTNTYTTIVATTGYRGNVLLPDGRVILVPNNATAVGLFNYLTNSFTTFISGLPGNFAYTGGVLLPDGRVVFVPHNATTIGILTPTQRVRRPPPELCYHPCFNKF